MLLLLALACQPVPLPTDSGGEGDGGGAAEAPTIASLRQGGAAEGSSVRVGDLVLTSGRSRDGRVLYVQDAGGGPWSGVRVVLAGTFEDLQPQVGQQALVAGTWGEVEGTAEIVVSAPEDLQLGDALVEAVATDLDPAVLAEEGEAWEGVLVRLGPQVLGGCPDAFGQVALDSGLWLDDDLATWPAGQGATVDSLTGVLAPALGQQRLLPRSADDLAGYDPGAGCLTTIPALHALLAEGQATQVELVGVVATSGPTRGAPAGFFVQAPGGGPASGLLVDPGALPAPAVGDRLDLTGRARRDGELLTLQADSLEITGASEPVADLVDPAALAGDWTAWQGALVTVEGVQTTGAPDAWAQCPLGEALLVGSAFLDCTLPAGSSLERLTGLATPTGDGQAVQPRDAGDLGG